jgi:hypothetical protein
MGEAKKWVVCAHIQSPSLPESELDYVIRGKDVKAQLLQTCTSAETVILLFSPQSAYPSNFSP